MLEANVAGTAEVGDSDGGGMVGGAVVTVGGSVVVGTVTGEVVAGGAVVVRVDAGDCAV